jgi:hypothetical protein
MAARPRVHPAVPDLLVDVQGAVPAAVDEHRDQEPGHRVALAVDAGQAEPAPGDRHRAGVVAQHPDEPGDRQADQDQVLHDGHADLDPGRDLDADHGDHQHDQADGAADAHIGPGVGGTGAEHSEHGGAEQEDLGHRPDDVGGDHQPAGQDAQVRVDSPADPFERRAGVRLPQVQPPVGVGDDQHRDRGQDQDRRAAVGGRHHQGGQRQPDGSGRGRRGHADDRVLSRADGVGLESRARSRSSPRDRGSRVIGHVVSCVIRTTLTVRSRMNQVKRQRSNVSRARPGFLILARIFRLPGGGPAFVDATLERGEPVAGGRG